MRVDHMIYLPTNDTDVFTVRNESVFVQTKQPLFPSVEGLLSALQPIQRTLRSAIFL